MLVGAVRKFMDQGFNFKKSENRKMQQLSKLINFLKTKPNPKLINCLFLLKRVNATITYTSSLFFHPPFLEGFTGKYKLVFFVILAALFCHLHQHQEEINHPIPHFHFRTASNLRSYFFSNSSIKSAVNPADKSTPSAKTPKPTHTPQYQKLHTSPSPISNATPTYGTTCYSPTRPPSPASVSFFA